MHRLPRPLATRAPGSRRSRRTVAVLTTLALAAGLAGFTGANAATTVNSSETSSAGIPVVRAESTTVTVNPGARYFFRSNSSSPYTTPNTPLCTGNNTPVSELVVTGPGGIEIYREKSPVKNLLTGAVVTPRPASLNALQYAGGAWTSASISLAGRASGTYVATTTVVDKQKTGVFGSCVNSISTETSQFEYRPWQEQFKDLLGTGAIRMNTTPKEFQFDVSGGASPIVTGTAGAGAMKLYSVPNSASFALSIPNPGACGTDPLSCLPTTAVTCDPATGCAPRFATIDYNGGADKLVGLFDLETQAFTAVATTAGHTRVLLSGGSSVDATLHSMLDQLNQMAAGLGIDLPALLGTTVDLNIQRPDGSTDVVQISVLRLIEIFNVQDGPATGIGLKLPASIGAGVITHLGTWLTGAPINPALHDANGDHSGFGYTVTEASALPQVPSLPVPLNILLPPGKIKHVTGKIPAGSGGHLVAIGATTDGDAATGLPISVPPVSTPRLVPDNGIDFIGTTVTTVSAELCISGLGCFGGAALLGTGVATFGPNPLPVNFGSIPLLWGDELGLGAVMSPVDALVSDIAGQLLSNPAVSDLLGTLPLGSVLPGGSGGGTGGLPGGAILGNPTNLLQLF